MSTPWHWPALAGAAPAPAPLGYRRGIWGKVQGEVSDYRWICRSEGFAQGCADLAGALRLGPEDAPVRAPLWRRLPDRYLAVAVYPSRARDSAGRLTVVEKQVCEWRPTPGMPAAAAALTLLPQAARFGDGDWWDRYPQGDWQRPDYALPLAPTDGVAVRADTGHLAAQITHGLDTLFETVTPSALRAFYVELLGGRFPARLSTPAPLSPAALACLLLPLPRHWADRLSLAGGLAARAGTLRTRLHNWDALAADWPAPAAAAADPALAGTAALMVDALARDAPESLPNNGGDGAADDRGSGLRLDRNPTMDDAVCAPTSRPTVGPPWPDAGLHEAAKLTG